MTEDYRAYGDRLAPYIADTPPIAWNALDEGRLVVFEGAQGTLLDIDHGTYPFVTSSNPVAGAACVGAGVGPKAIDEVWGITKAYCTRVGAGPFPTELHDEMGDRIRDAGSEFGTTTGRARRCGWLDLVALRYARAGERAHRPGGHQARRAHRASTRYRWPSATPGPEGASFDEFPYHQSVLHQARGELVELPGLARGHLRRPVAVDDLPANARAYLEFIEEQLGIPVVMVGRGPGPRRDDLDGRRRAAAPDAAA